MFRNAKSWCAAAVAALVVSAAPAGAATLTVNSNGDTPDTTPGDATCGAPGPGSTCTLRAAIQEANANADTSNTIGFDSSQSGQTTTAATAYPAITKSLTVTGPANRFTVDGNAANPVSLFRYTGSGGTYAITGINFKNGRTSASAGGGCIYFAPVGTASFNITNAEIRDCDATAGPGGGIAMDLLANGSSVILNGVRVGLTADITGAGPNTASGNGGGLWFRMVGTGSMTVQNSSVVANSAANGGGIAVARGRLTLANSTISGNTATTAGGGLFLGTETVTTGGNVRMENVTVSGNTAAQGGGIAASTDNPTASWVTFSTVTLNTGGGIRAQASPQITFPGNLFNPFTSNIVANNTGGNCAAAFTHADPANSGYNLTDSSICGFTQTSDHVVATADLKLAALAANPAAPNTHALLAGSPAIDAGNLNWVNATTLEDERGADAQDGNLDSAVTDPLRDIGAYEFGGFGLIQFAFPGAPNNFDVDEDNSPALVLIHRYGTGSAADSTPTVAFSTGGGNATAGTCGSGGSDYTALANPTNFAFTATQFEQTASLAICNDQIAEGNETFNITLAKPAGGDAVGYDLGPRVSGTTTIVEAENGTFQFNPITASAVEGDPGSSGTATVTITRTVGSKGTVRVNYATTSTGCTPACTATADTDYASTTSFVDFADGETSKTVNIALIGDTADEPGGGETFQVNLTGVSCQSLPAGRTCDARLVGNAGDANRTATATITDDDAAVPGALQFELAAYTATEDSTTLTVKVKRVGGKDGAVSVTYGATDGTATDDPGPNQDYVVAGNPPGTFTLSWANQDAADKTFDVTLIDDSTRESDKTFTLNLTNPQGGATLGTPSSAPVRLVSDEQPTFQFSAATYSVQENGTSVTVTVNSTCTPAPPCFTGPNVTIPYFTRDGTATSPADYTGVPEGTPGTLTFGNNDASKTIVIMIANDTAVEGNENFTVHLGDAQGGAQVAGTNPATVTIVDSAAVRFTATSFPSASELNGSGITVSAERVGNLSGMVSAGFTISQACSNPAPAGCAVEATDYTRAGGFTGTLQWNDMEGGSKSFTITIIGDTVIEGDETIQVSLAAGVGSPAIGNSPATAVITDDDYRFEILDASPLSISEGAGNAAVQVRRVGSTVGAASLGYATADGTAVAGSDYTATMSPPALSWNAGEGGTKTLNVPVTDDAVDEMNESFTVALNSPSNNASGEATPVAGSPLTVEIADNDAVTVSFSAAAQTVGENAGTVTVTAMRTGDTTFDITVPFTVSGTAANPADHNAGGGSIMIPAGSTSGNTTFTVNDDAVDEPDETVVFSMGTPTGGDVAAAAPTTHAATIADNDAPRAGEQAPAIVVVPSGGGVSAAPASNSGGGAFSGNALLGLLGLLRLRRRRQGLVALALLALVPTPAGARELSYNYAELRYVTVSVDDPSVDAAGFSLSGSWRVAPRHFLGAGCSTAKTDDFTVHGATGSTESTSLNLFAGYRQALRKGLDLNLVASVIRADVDASGGFAGSASDTGWGFETGLRGLYSDAGEWGAAVTYVSIFDDSATSLVAQWLYHFDPRFTLAAGAGIGDNSTQFNLGARVNF
jgi:CSLREA domain-containing protein